MNDKQLYEQILQIYTPWHVSNVKIDMTNKEIRVTVSHDSQIKGICPECKRQCIGHDHRHRQWRHLDTCQLRTIIECDVPRINCPEHGVKQILVPWAETGSRLTGLFEALAIQLLQNSNITDVRKQLGMSWSQVSAIEARAVKRGLQRRKEEPITSLAIDETSYQKRHQYVTVLVDRERDRVIDILEDRKSETLSKWLSRNKTQLFTGLKEITMDMWDPFIKAVRENFENWNELICFDRFHIAQYFGKAVDKVRAEEHRVLGRLSPLKKTRYSWLRNSQKTDNRKRPDFMNLTKLHLKTSRAWAIKETASMLWSYKYRGVAVNTWKKLLSWISRCRLEAVIKVGKMVKKHLWGILNAITAEVTNAIAEGKNTRIQKIKSSACGFRNKERFRTAILFRMGKLNMLPNVAC